jgi:DHA1 family bicyclomycin/chloramphenicol resistance-like MFS transporter
MTRRHRTRAVQLAVIGGLSSFGPLSLDLYLPALPRVARALHATDGVTQLSISACLVGLAIGQLAFGPVSDRFGRRRPLLVGVALWTITAAACALAPDVEILVLLRLLQGLGGAAGLVIARAVIRDRYDGRALTRAYGVQALMSNIAPAIAPVAGGALLHVMSWRGLFLVLTGVGCVLLSGTWLGLPESLAVDQRRPGGARQMIGSVSALRGDRSFVGAAGVYALSSAVLFTYISLSSFVLQQRFGLSAGTFSLVFAGNSIGIILTGSLTIALLRRRGARAVLAGGLALMVVGVAALCVAVSAGWGTGIVLVALLAAIAALGIILPTATALALRGHAEQAGAASALLGGSQYLAGALAGPLVSLSGATGTAMAVGMAIFTVAALISYWRIGGPRGGAGAGRLGARAQRR